MYLQYREFGLLSINQGFVFPEHFLYAELDCRRKVEGGEVDKRKTGEFPTDRCGNYGKIQLYLPVARLPVARLIVFSKPIFRGGNVSFILRGYRKSRGRMTASHTSDT